ncbi:MAG: BamA/TamA family outer membrane protein, partial [Myxococcales bacterium]|nr:BamA/TamA family outer membrane protein [Myxococcales bacterium]
AFYLGGVDTIRGYLQDALIPQDVAERVIGDLALSPNQVARAADAFALLRAELRFPIVGNLQGGVFTDVGNAWADPTRLLEDFTLRPTAGAGLRYATPVGPLAIDYGILLHRRRALDEGFGAFHFSIGLF